MSTGFDNGLACNAVDFIPFTPIEFLTRTVDVYGDRLAIMCESVRQNWCDAYEHVRRLASALSPTGAGRGDTVAAPLPNTSAMVGTRFRVPMTGGVLNALSIRLDTVNLVFTLRCDEVCVLLADTELVDLIHQIVLGVPDPKVIAVNDALDPQAEPFDDIDYETFLVSGDLHYAWQLPVDEWDAIALDYTSGTTGGPKGVVYHYRGAITNTVLNILEWDLSGYPVYLWTLPISHCNDWCFSRTITVRVGVNVCLCKFEPRLVFGLTRDEGMTHYCAASVMHAAPVNVPSSWREGPCRSVRGMVAGAPSLVTMSVQMEVIGLELTYAYGLTEVYGSAAVCVEQDEWRALLERDRAVMKACQGVRYHLQS